MTHPNKERTVAAPGGRYLRRFTLQNVRTFRSPVTLDFCHPDGKVSQWTVILGENGTGKTTLLQYLAGLTVVPDEGAAQASASGEKSLPPFRPMFASREWLTWIAANIPRPWSKPTEVTAQLELTAVAKSLVAAGPERAKFGNLELKLSFGETPDGAPLVTTSYLVRKDAGFYASLRLFAYGASRHVAGSASPYLSSDTFFQNGGGSPVSTIFHDDYPLISPEQWLLGLDHAAGSGKGEMASAAKHALQSARRCLTGTLPNVLDLSIKPHGLLKGQSAMTLMCRTPYGEVPFGSLSVGYRTMAAWLTDFVKRMHEAYSALINRRTELRQKLKLTKAETSELAEIEKRIQAEAAPQESDASKWLFQKLQQALERTANPSK